MIELEAVATAKVTLRQITMFCDTCRRQWIEVTASAVRERCPFCGYRAVEMIAWC